MNVIMGLGIISHGSIQLSQARLRKVDYKVKQKRENVNEIFKDIFLRERCLEDLYSYSEL